MSIIIMIRMIRMLIANDNPKNMITIQGVPLYTLPFFTPPGSRINASGPHQQDELFGAYIQLRTFLGWCYPKLAGWFIGWKINLKMDENWGNTHFRKAPYLGADVSWFKAS